MGMNTTDKFQIALAIGNLKATLDKLAEIRLKAEKEGLGPYYEIGYLQSTIRLAHRRLEAFAEANPDFTNWKD